MKKYYFIGGSITFILIFNLGYVFHELLMGDFFKEHIGNLQRDSYIIPLVAFAFIFYTIFQAYFLPIYFQHTSSKYGWGITRTAIVFGTITGFFWDGLQGGIIEVATFKMPFIVFIFDSGYHTLEGIATALLLALFYRKFNLKTPGN